MRHDSTKVCSKAGPDGAHCTNLPGHRWACYDATRQVSWDLQTMFKHWCREAHCPGAE